MTYVIQDACVKCKYGDCVEVCPVNCFYEGEDQLFINPDECIDCDACRETCPVEAIFRGEDADPAWLEKAKAFEYSEDTRREAKDDVTHGPNWDPAKA